MSRDAERVTKREPPALVRFLVTGGANTAITYLLYLLLLVILPYKWSYTVSYLCGIVLAYELNRVFVFRAQRSLTSAALMPLVYVVQYLIGIGVVHVWVEALHLPRALAPLAAVAISVPLTYLLNKLVFMRNKPIV